MRRVLASAIALLALAPYAWGQSVTKICLPRVLPNGVGSCVDVTTTNPFPVNATVTASSAATAASTLPTISAGAGPFYQSLGGSLYVQPVFGTSVGGGTQVDATHGLPVNVVAGGGSGGTSSSFAAAFPATGTAIGVKNGLNMVNLSADGSSNLNVDLATALPSGANTIGAVTQASGPWTTNQTQIGSAAYALGSALSAASAPVVIASDQAAVAVKQATAASLNATVVGTGTFAVQDSTTETNTGTIAGAVSAAVMQSNTKQVNGVTTLTGAGVVGTGSQRVAVGQDTTTIAGSAPGTAGTASSNVVTVQGIASMTAVKVDGSSVTQPVSGTVTSNQGTANATPWNDNVVQFGGNAVATGTGVGGSGVPRVTVSNDSKMLVWDSTNTATVKAASTSPATTDTALVAAISPNPAPVCTGVININQTSTTDVHTFTNIGYICAVMLISATAQNIGIDEGTGTTCETSGTALIGVSATATATPSLAVAANGGFSSVAASPWLKLQASADHLCVLQSGAGNVSGTITYADHP